MIGQDGGQSIRFGERTLFVFSDTLFRAAPAARPVRRGDSPFAAPLREREFFLANCAAVTEAREFSRALATLRYYVDDAGLPRQIFETGRREREEKIRFWPLHGIFHDGLIYLYFLGIRTVDPGTVWGFRNLGTGLARLDPETGACERLESGGDWRWWRPAADDARYGVQVIRRDRHLYVFGSVRRGLDCTARLARVGAGDLTRPAAYVYLASTGPEPRWSADPEAACDLGECGSDYSVSYNPHLGKYTLFYVDSHDKRLMLRTAGRLWGPYSPPQRLAGLPHEPASEMIYLGFEHPDFRQGGGRTTFLSYCQPRFLANAHVALTFRAGAP